jgi:FtsP/CotA-like multicopper oxidase with cupredoxin domain
MANQHRDSADALQCGSARQRLQQWFKSLKSSRWLSIGLVVLVVVIAGFANRAPAQSQLAVDAAIPVDFAKLQSCYRPPTGSEAVPPNNVIVNGGKPIVEFTIKQVKETVKDAKGVPQTVLRDCYVYQGGNEGALAPTIRVRPGDTLNLKLTNGLPKAGMTMPDMAPPNSSNLHFHGLNLSPRPPQDDSVTTIVQPNQSFNYKLQIPSDEPPGLYWYHPHVHMLAGEQVSAGLSGALIVQGIGRVYPKVRKLPEQVIVLRDQLPIENPDVNPNQSWQDISINNVPIVFPKQTPAKIYMQPKKQQFWRVVNAGANTYFNVQVLYNGTPQKLEVIARDGVVLDEDNGKLKSEPILSQSILLPPAARAEFVVPGLPKDARGELVTLQYNTGINPTFGDKNLRRILATLLPTVKKQTLDISSVESNEPNTPKLRTRFTNLANVKVSRQRTFFFSQCTDDQPSTYFPKCQVVGEPEFYITEEGRKPKLYANSDVPAVTVRKNAIEDWRIVNLDQEAHAFHMHQIHFRVLGSPDGAEVGTMRDTINIPGKNDNAPLSAYSTNLRMDFRGDIVGTFLYHCHILEHEDKGMMAKIEVKP